jgi:hypothetical protein
MAAQRRRAGSQRPGGGWPNILQLRHPIGLTAPDRQPAAQPADQRRRRVDPQPDPPADRRGPLDPELLLEVTRMTKTTDEVVAIERGFWTMATDPGYFKQNMADEALSVIEPLGFVEKAQAVAWPAEAPWQNVEMLDLIARETGPDCVILAYHGRAQRDGADKPYQGSIASTYCRIDGRWRLVLTSHQPWTPDEGPGKAAAGSATKTAG